MNPEYLTFARGEILYSEMKKVTMYMAMDFDKENCYYEVLV